MVEIPGFRKPVLHVLGENFDVLVGCAVGVGLGVSGFEDLNDGFVDFVPVVVDLHLFFG